MVLKAPMSRNETERDMARIQSIQILSRPLPVATATPRVPGETAPGQGARYFLGQALPTDHTQPPANLPWTRAGHTIPLACGIQW